MAADTPPAANVRHRPRATTVFVAAFVAGAAAAVGVNRVLDVHLAQAKPQVECEPIFVALRSLPQGVPVTVWDVALRDWPKAMLPTSALRVTDSFEGRLLKYPLREGQPLLAAQLLQPEVVAPVVDPKPDTTTPEEEIVEEAFIAPVPAAAPVAIAPPSEPAAPLTATSESEPTSEPAVPSVATSAVATAEAPAVATTEPSAGVSAEPEAEMDRADSDETASIAAQDAPEPQPIPEPPAVAPQSNSAVVAGEPTLAAPATSPATSWAAVAGPQTPRDADDASPGVEPAFDLPAQPAVDLSSLPSVMAREDATDPPEEQAAAAGDVRYLVVPERIARQADTSFTTPIAPEAQPAVEPALAEASQTTAPALHPSRQAAPDQAQQRQAQQRQAQQRQAQQRQAQQRQAQQRQAQQRPMQPGQRQAQGQQQLSEPSQQKTDPRAWGGMFPNVSAGLEAIGSWRGRVREAVVPQQPGAGQPAPQRR